METGNAEAMNCRVKDEGDDVMRRQQYWIYPRDMEVLYSKMRLVGLDGVVHTVICRGAGINKALIYSSINWRTRVRLTLAAPTYVQSS